MERKLDNLGPIPTEPLPLSDTDPEPFGHRSDQDDTAKRCYMCGRGDLSGYDAGVAYAIRELRKFFASHMSGSQAIAVTERFRAWLRK